MTPTKPIPMFGDRDGWDLDDDTEESAEPWDRYDGERDVDGWPGRAPWRPDVPRPVTGQPAILCEWGCYPYQGSTWTTDTADSRTPAWWAAKLRASSARVEGLRLTAYPRGMEHLGERVDLGDWSMVHPLAYPVGLPPPAASHVRLQVGEGFARVPVARHVDGEPVVVLDLARLEALVARLRGKR